MKIMSKSNSLKNDVFINLIQNLKDQQLNSLKSIASQILKQIEYIENIETAKRQLANGNGLHLYEILEQIEKDLISVALMKAGGNQTKAARLLKLNATTHNEKIKRLKIDYR